MSVFIGYPSFMAYQMMKGKKGNNDGFPSIPGMIARYSASGLTNEQMAANPVWVDKTGNGHDIQLKNFPWKEGSGISDVYPGALVFDGVDDYGVCDNFPILTKEKGYTVVALRSYLAESIGYLVYNGTNAKQSAFAFERSDSLDTWSWGKNSSIRNLLPKLMSYQTSNSYNNNIISTGTAIEGDKLIRIASVGGYSNVAIWELVFLDHDATEEELTKIKDYFVKTYPWLFPDQAWTVTGKTNEDEDRATIANITGNGNDLVLSNFGFAEGSGYGLYAENYSNSRWFINNSITATKKSDTFNVTSINQAAVQIQYIAEPSQSPYTVPSYTIKVTGLTDGQTVNYRVSGGISYPITQDGIYILPGFDFAGMGSWYGFQFNKVQESCDITIEQIPEYEGYLVTDGVDDEVRSAAFTLNEDWTIVGNWEFITNENKNAGLTKVYSFYLYNRDYGIFVYEYLNAGQGFSVEDVKSLKAICSDGRIYLNDWQEIRNNIEQEATISKGVMAIGYFNRDFTKMAFKNLGIYNDQLLSKDDCIKAYNYLQTLKAK